MGGGGGGAQRRLQFHPRIYNTGVAMVYLRTVVLRPGGSVVIAVVTGVLVMAPEVLAMVPVA